MTRIEYTVLNAPADVEADVTATGASSFELLGPGGVTITASSQTQWQDKSSFNLRHMGVAAPVVSILDLTIGTDDATVYADELGKAMTAAGFFARAAGHDVIVAARRAADGSLVASSMRLD